MPEALVISSRANPWFKRFRAAIEEHCDEIVVEGPKQVADCIASGWAPIAAASREGFGPLPLGAPRPLVFSETLFRSISETVESQGLLALFHRPTVSSRALLHRKGAFVVLDGIQDPGNAGTIVRLAAAFGAVGVLATEGTADLLSPKAIRASAGTVLSVPAARTYRNEITALARSGALPLYAARAGGGPLPSRLPERFALVLGSEGRGVTEEIAEVSTAVGIEMSGAVESLNVSAAAAILLWQIQSSRQAGIVQ